MNNVISQRSLDQLPAEIWFRILDNLPGEAVRNFLYTCKKSFSDFLWYFATREARNGLIHAAKHKDRNLLRKILSIDEVDVNMEDEDGKTALCFAVESADERMVRALIARSNINTQKPLRHAIMQQEDDMVELILQSGNVNLDATDCLRETMLHDAVLYGGPIIAELLASQARSSDFEKVNEVGMTPLHWAIRYGYEEVMDMYFSTRKARSNEHILENDLLLYAIKRRREFVALEILRLQGFQLATYPQGDVLLRRARREGLILVVAELQLQTTDANTTGNEGLNATQYASRGRNQAIESRLVESGVSPHADESALWATAQQGDFETFRLLLLYKGYGPIFHNSVCLQHAIRGRDERIIARVLRRTAHIDYNVVLVAVESDVADLLLLVIERLRSASTQINLGDLLLHAIQHDSVSVIELLLNKLHADPCYASSGRTALSYAAERGCLAVISLLLSHVEVNPNLRDGDGRIPLDYVLESFAPCQQNLRLLALDSRTAPSSFGDKGLAMMASLRTARQYWLLKHLRERGFEDKGFRKRRVAPVNTPNKMKRYSPRSRHTKLGGLLGKGT
ncbi:putative ankyrin repeat protein [Metarhizium anisopliae]|nr:putative ankyrin repeat protein [Metarhizium anisopliae]